MLSSTGACNVLLTSQICPAAPGLNLHTVGRNLVSYQKEKKKKIAEQFDPVSSVERLS